jgi:hypothetical protein
MIEYIAAARSPPEWLPAKAVSSPYARAKGL